MLQSKWGEIIPVRGVCVLGKIAWYTTQSEYGNFVYFIFVNLFLIFIVVTLHALDVLLLSSSVFPTPIPISQ